MGAKNYIAVIEIGSSKIAGAVGFETYEGVHIVAYAVEEVKKIISKGVVRNVDEAGTCITRIINILEGKIDDGIQIERAYVAYGGLSIHSRKSTVVREFPEYNKITQNIIDDIMLENEETFKVPEGYSVIQVLPLECRLNGNDVVSHIGVPTRRIECNFLNILIKEQFMHQMNDSFKMAKIEIVDSFNGAYTEALEVLGDDEKRSGAAVVNIGAQTTSISIFFNDLLRHHVVLPVGSDNITRDLENEKIGYNEAEMLKTLRGYAPSVQDDDILPTDVSNTIIGARMIEIFENVKHQIKLANEVVSTIVFTGGGSRLPNIEKLIEENFKSVKVRIATATVLPFTSDEGLSPDEVSCTLCSLLKTGKEICYSVPEVKAPEPVVPADLFDDEKEKEEIVEEKPRTGRGWSFWGPRREEDPAKKEEERKRREEEKQRKEEEERIRREAEARRKEEEARRKAEAKRQREEAKRKHEEEKKNGSFVNTLFGAIGDFVDNATKDENDGDFDDENN